MTVLGKPAGRKLDVAVFPLVNAVLFPGVTLPLQIFEDRYRKMLNDIRAREWPLAVPLVAPELHGDQVILNSICGAGEVQIFREHPDHRLDILVHGQERVKLRRILQSEPYLIMEAEILEPEVKEASAQNTRTFEEFIALIKTWSFLNPELPEHISLIFDEFKTFGQLSDFFVFHFLKEAQLKQVYLNCTDPIERSEMLGNYLENDLVRLSKKLVKSKRATLFH